MLWSLVTSNLLAVLGLSWDYSIIGSKPGDRRRREYDAMRFDEEIDYGALRDRSSPFIAERSPTFMLE